jgi:hypothetical protein
MVMMATKQHSYAGNGKDEDEDKDKRVTFHNMTISHKRGPWQQTRDDNGGGIEAARVNERR